MKLAWFLSEADIRDSREKSLSVKKKKKINQNLNYSIYKCINSA